MQASKLSQIRSLIQTVLLLQCVLQACTLAEKSPWPILHLRTGLIHTENLSSRQVTGQLRRNLLQKSSGCHTESSSWGVLHGAHQLLASHLPDMDHVEHMELVKHLESAGVHIMGYIPDNTMLLVGSPSSLEVAANHSSFVWVGEHDASYKRAPEWDQVLKDIQVALDAVEAESKPSKSGIRKVDGPGNSTIIAQHLVAASLGGLEVQTTNRPGEWPLVGIQVVFPSLHAPKPLATHHHGYHMHEKRMKRVEQHKQQLAAGDAAFIDWQPLLQDTFGAEIEVQSGGPHAAVVFAPVSKVADVVDWLVQRPSVHWVAPLPKFMLRNRQASSIVQSAKGVPSAGGNVNVDPSYHPLWAAGLTGKNQVIGIGDSGIDRNHCFFTDPNVDWAANTKIVDGKQTFSSEQHRKIRYYRAYADMQDDNGHGTHVSGTAAGMPYGVTLAGDTAKSYIGMAPDAKIAFADFSSRTDGETIKTPADLSNGYFKYTSAVGAHIHSDSWGSNSLLYDKESSVVDGYCWENDIFLPVFPSGNAGDYTTSTGYSGETTINSPATSKNCIAAGATQSQSEKPSFKPGTFSTWTATANVGSGLTSVFRVLQSAFGPSVSTLGTKSYNLVSSSPLDGCTALNNGATVAGSVVMIERGGVCDFATKAKNAAAAGAAAAIFFDNKLGSYFTADATAGVTPANIPSMVVTRRIGQNLLAVLGIGRGVTISFAASTLSDNSFDNLASYSSQGPTLDSRIKPDLVAPGTITSAQAQTGSSSTTCGLVTYGGTSMATPVVAGSAVLVRQYYTDGYYPSGTATPANAMNPSAALIKATLIGGATSIIGFEADTGLPIDPPPSFRQGFGRVFLGESLFLQSNPYSPKRMQVLDRVQITTGQTHQYCIKAGGGPLSITIVWTDYPGSPTSRKNLVNNLDLTVRAEGYNGIPLLGNGGSVEDSNKPDNVNNVEQVSLSEVPAGQVSIEVKGASVQGAFGAQPYAIVVLGDFTGNLVAPQAKSSSSGGECAVLVPVITGGPDGLTNANPVQFTFNTASGVSQGIEFECKLGDSNGNITGPGMVNWSPCVSPASYSGVPDGIYQFSVRAKGETISSSKNFVKDGTPPVVTANSNTLATTSQPTANVTFSATDASAVTYACTLSETGAATAVQGEIYADNTFKGPIKLNTPFNCTSPEVFFWLMPGQYSFAVQGTDAAGNQAQPAQASWTVALDPSKRYARFKSGPYGPVPKAALAFDFLALSASANGAVSPIAAASAPMECSLTEANAAPTWAACVSPVTNANIKDGSYRFMVRLAGDATPASTATGIPDTWAVSDFVVDSTPPRVTVSSSPTGIAGSGNVVVDFTMSEEATAQCKLTPVSGGKGSGYDYTPCTSPARVSNLTDGVYTLNIRATDVVGNVGQPVEVKLTVDSTPPSFTSLSVPNATNTGTVTITFTTQDNANGSGLKNTTCRLRPGVLVNPAEVNAKTPEYDWTACSSPLTYQNLKEGQWEFSIQAFDNGDLSSGIRAYNIYQDTKPPVANVTGAPSVTGIATGDLVFKMSDLSLQPLGSASPVPVWQVLLKSLTQEQFDQLKAGNLDVLNNGGANNGSTPVAVQKIEWVTPSDSSSTNLEDSTYEVVHRPFSNVTTPSLAANNITSTAAIAEQEPKTLGSGAVNKWTNCTSVCTYSGVGSGYYVFQTKGIDAAGNVGQVSSPTWFQYEGSSSSLSMSIIIAIIAGSIVALLAVAGLTWWACKRKNHSSSSNLPAGAMTSTTQYPPVNGYYPAANGNGAYNPYGNGYARPASPLANGTAVNGWGAPVAVPNGYGATPAQLEEEQVRLALEASKREEQERKKRSKRRYDPQVQAAIEASLQETRPSRPAPPPPTANYNPYGAPAAPAANEDEMIRLAIEQSLREQSRSDWAPSPSGDSAWPPQR